MTTRIDYILQSGPDKMTEVMHGTPSMVASWLKLMPKTALLLYVNDTEVGLIVTARQYVERFDTGASNYDKPQVDDYIPENKTQGLRLDHLIIDEIALTNWPE